MKHCQKCNEEDTMYRVESGWKCANCKEQHTRKTGLIDERPTKPHDAVCGELLTETPNGDVRIPKMIKPMCNDGTECSFNPTTMTEDENGDWMASCATHA